MYQPSEQLVCPFFCIDLELAASITTNNRQMQTTVSATSTRFLLTTYSKHFLKPYFINALLVLNRIRATGTRNALTTGCQRLCSFTRMSNASPVITPFLRTTTSFPPLHGNAAWSS